MEFADDTKLCGKVKYAEKKVLNRFIIKNINKEASEIHC